MSKPEMPWYYESAINLMLDQPGIGYERAAQIVKSTQPAPERGGITDLMVLFAQEPEQDYVPTTSESDPYGTPWFYQAAVDLFMASPGMSYENAVQQIKGGGVKAAPARPAPKAPQGTPDLVGLDMGIVTYEERRSVEDDPFGKPAYFEEATRVMMASPGLEWDQAVEQVKARSRNRGSR